MFKNNKILKFVLYIFIVLFIIFGLIRYSLANFFIAHALGEYNGIFYSNSKEAFENSYKKGFRQFEADLTKTSDGRVVCFHAYSPKIYEKLHIK